MQSQRKAGRCWGLAGVGGDPCLGFLGQICLCIRFRAPATTSPLAVNLGPHYAEGHLVPWAKGCSWVYPGKPRSPGSLEQNEARDLRNLHFFFLLQT